MSRYSKKHYEDIAKVINNTLVDLKAYQSVNLRPLTDKETVSHIVSNFTTMLYNDNQENFDTVRFIEACNK